MANILVDLYTRNIKEFLKVKYRRIHQTYPKMVTACSKISKAYRTARISWQEYISPLIHEIYKQFFLNVIERCIHKTYPKLILVRK